MSTVIAAAIIGSVLFGLSRMSIASIRHYNHQEKKFRAEQYSAELLELFLAHTPEELRSYLATNPINPVGGAGYPLCAHINLIDWATAAKLKYNQDPNADIYEWPEANRFYQVQVIDITTLAPNSAVCGLTSDSYCLNPNERYLISVGATYPSVAQPGKYERVILSSVLPKAPSGACVLPPATIDIRANGQNGPVNLSACPSTVTISWTSQRATNCSITDSVGSAAVSGTSGSFTSPPMNYSQSYTYTATCQSVTGQVVDTVIVNPEANFRRVFITSDTFNGNLGGLSGAHAKCQAAAAAANLLNASSFKAILSDVSTDAKDIININGPVYNNCGGCPALIATNSTDFWSTWTTTSHCNENSVAQPTPLANAFDSSHTALHVWTATNSSGNRSPALPTNTNTCSSFTSNGSGRTAATGDASATNSNRFIDTAFASHTCDKQLRLYCISQ